MKAVDAPDITVAESPNGNGADRGEAADNTPGEAEAPKPSAAA